jgi:DNA-binding CsgD family transcriptional regulator
MPQVVLDERSLRKVMAAADVAAELSLTEDVPDLLAAAASLVPCDVLFWNWYSLVPRLQTFAHVDARSTRPVRRAPLDGWLAHLPEHPIMSGRHGPVVAVSDVLSPAQLDRSWLYQEAMRPAGLRHEIGLELSHGRDEMSALVFSREPGRDFDERDHLVLRLLRCHLDAALRRVARPRPRLTSRERSVLLLVREGLTDAQVARRLGITEATVGKHLEHVYARIGARSRVQALSLCADELEHALAVAAHPAHPGRDRTVADGRPQLQPPVDGGAEVEAHQHP